MFVFKDGGLFIGMGSPAGGRKATAMAQVVANVVDFGMPIDVAVSVDRIHSEDIPEVVSIEPHFDPRTAVELAGRGHRVIIEGYTARVEAVLRDPVTSVLSGGTDPRGDRGLAVV